MTSRTPEPAPRATTTGADTLPADLATRLRGVRGEALREAVYADQADRWGAGRPLPAEAYLRGLPALGGSEEAALDVIYHEVVIRRGRGEQPDPDEYAGRFPAYACRLRTLLQLDGALMTDLPTSALPPVRSSLPDIDPSEGLPASVGPYRIVARLGKGGQGEVFRAVHPTLNSDVVVKVSHRACPAGWAEPLFQEGRTLAALRHPNILRVLDIGLHEGRAYLAMEYAAGLSLDQSYRLARPAPRDAARLVAQLARGLEAIHSKGVLHLDLKPANILVEEGGDARLIDFGLAQIRDAWGGDPEEGGISGTIAFMAPEQARPEPDRIGPRTDVYALGGVLYFLLTGKPPRAGETFAASLAQAQMGEWDRSGLEASAAPRSLKRLCEAALAADPDGRPASAGAFAASLEAAARRRTWPLWSAAACLACLGVAALAWALLPRTAPARIPPLAPRETLAARVRFRGAFKGLVNRVPVRTGEGIQVEAEVPADLHAVLVGQDSSGAVRTLAAWPAVPEARTVRFPSGIAEEVPLEGEPGTEVLILLARRSGPISTAEATAWIGSRAWPVIAPTSVLRMHRGRAWIAQKGRGFGPARSLTDPESLALERLEAFRGRLTDEVEWAEAIVFPHVAPDWSD